jgi:hypothetical protein
MVTEVNQNQGRRERRRPGIVLIDGPNVATGVTLSVKEWLGWTARVMEAAEAEQEQVQGFGVAVSRADQALERGAEALKKATVAAAATRLSGAHGLYLQGKAALDEAGQAVKSAPGRESTRAKVRELERELMRLYWALDTVKDLVFAPGPTDWDGQPSQADAAVNEAHCCGWKTRQKKEGVPWF